MGSQTGSRDDYDELREISDPGTILVDDTNPVELAAFMKEKQVDLFIGGVKERPLAYKLGVAFCDHNHERKQPLAGFEGMVNFAAEVHASATSPVWQFAPRRAARPIPVEPPLTLIEPPLTLIEPPLTLIEPPLTLEVLSDESCQAGTVACQEGSSCSHCH